MNYSKIKNSELSVSKISFGCAPIGGYDYGAVDDAESISAIHKAIDLGVNLFDVADVYGFGHAENILNKALSGISSNIYIATKVGVRWDDTSSKTWRDLSPNYIESAVDASLMRLGVERLDICQLHWPINNIPPLESIHTLEKIKKSGKINLLGVCNVSGEWLFEAEKSGNIDLLQTPLSIFDQKNSMLIKTAREKYNMGVFVYNALAHGLLTGKIKNNFNFHENDLRNRVDLFSSDSLPRALAVARSVDFVAKEIGLQPAQIAISFLLSTTDVTSVLVGVKNISQAECNFGSNIFLPNWAIEMIENSCVLNNFR
jgi:aryl-alcohol dehydrogenase-like predicted oxidoreductase